MRGPESNPRAESEGCVVCRGLSGGLSGFCVFHNAAASLTEVS